MFHYKEHGLENLLPQEIMSKGHTPLEDTDHNTIIYGRVFETADVLTDFQECQPYVMIIHITSPPSQSDRAKSELKSYRSSRCRFRRS